MSEVRRTAGNTVCGGHLRSPQLCSPFLKKGLLLERLNERTRCLVCKRRCALREGQLGWCCVERRI